MFSIEHFIPIWMSAWCHQLINMSPPPDCLEMRGLCTTTVAELLPLCSAFYSNIRALQVTVSLTGVYYSNTSTQEYMGVFGCSVAMITSIVRWLHHWCKANIKMKESVLYFWTLWFEQPTHSVMHFKAQVSFSLYSVTLLMKPVYDKHGALELKVWNIYKAVILIGYF